LATVSRTCSGRPEPGSAGFPALVVAVHHEGDIAVEAVFDDLAIFDDGLLVFHVEVLDVKDRLAGFLDCALCGVVLALVRLGDDLDDFGDIWHGSSLTGIFDPED
jgi:hypothetical protein